MKTLELGSFGSPGCVKATTDSLELDASANCRLGSKNPQPRANRFCLLARTSGKKVPATCTNCRGRRFRYEGIPS